VNLIFHFTPFGRFAMGGTAQAVTNLYFETDPLPPEYGQIATPVLTEAAAQLDAYLSGRLREFTIPLDPRGTPFMRRVWEELRLIPYGSTASFKDVAARAGNPKAARAAGLANNRNPIPIFIPCHRVVGATGRLTGYRGGLYLKRKLLELEEASGLR
jgi:methylated-DNA-[protein]-cysteine S-methyltransferase